MRRGVVVDKLAEGFLLRGGGVLCCVLFEESKVFLPCVEVDELIG